jgi:AraC-like DNA-binding protein
LAQAEQHLKRIWRPQSFKERVHEAMRRRMAAGLPDMEVVARELGLSVRSLRRHLDEEGTSFRELTQEALYETACTMLRNPNITLQNISHTLGFSDASAFHRAFRRWSELTPAEYRSEFLNKAQQDTR